ncbi:MAG: helix-turn-helix domain-containing protein [Chloroflexota bacterium]
MSSFIEEGKKRNYNSPRRQEQAQATRQRILEAARRLFVERGYVAATLPAIAREAGVAAPTLTFAFGTKFAILDAVIKLAVRGDEAPVPLEIRSWWQEMLAEPDPVRKLNLFAAHSRRIHERTTDIFEIVRGAATADPEIAALRRELNASRLQDVKGVAQSLAQKGSLRPGLAPEQATDLLWTLGAAETYRMLVVERGWPPDHYERWLASVLIHSFLG